MITELEKERKQFNDLQKEIQELEEKIKELDKQEQQAQTEIPPK